jgi:glycosyltransferase involved in cell wall biosynthesis
MYSEETRKGSIYGMEAIKLVKNIYQDLTVIAFSQYKKPRTMPEWVEFKYLPNNLCEIYNNSAIFMTNSLAEGWGLPATEAMFSGCALICTNVGGHLEFAINNKTALLVEPMNPEQMANAILTLINDNNFRIQIAKQGNEFIQRFCWYKSVERLEQLMKN